MDCAVIKNTIPNALLVNDKRGQINVSIPEYLRILLLGVRLHSGGGLIFPGFAF